VIPVPLIAFPIALLATLLLSGGTAFWGYEHGIAIQEARDAKADLAQAQQDLKDHKKNDAIADKAGKDFEDAKPKIRTKVEYRDREIHIPPDADPFVPVWFVRMFNDIASVEPPADAYPGQSDSAPSRTRLSGTRAVLKAWAIKYETCRKQVDSIRELNAVLPTPPSDKPDLFTRLNPF
jgi:hypothetical protein